MAMVFLWQMLVEEEKLKQLPCTAVDVGDLQYLVSNAESTKAPSSILSPNAVEAAGPPLPIKIRVDSV